MHVWYAQVILMQVQKLNMHGDAIFYQNN